MIQGTLICPKQYNSVNRLGPPPKSMAAPEIQVGGGQQQTYLPQVE